MLFGNAVAESSLTSLIYACDLSVGALFYMSFTPGVLFYYSPEMQTSVPGFKFRRRKIANFPTGGEGSCAHLVEATPCDEPSCYSWQLLGLGECVPAEDTDCGPGNQLPQTRCVDTAGETRRTSAPRVKPNLEITRILSLGKYLLLFLDLFMGSHFIGRSFRLFCAPRSKMIRYQIKKIAFMALVRKPCTIRVPENERLP